MKIKNLAWALVCMTTFLVGCGPNEKELSEKGFSSKKEMDEYGARGYKSKRHYVEKSFAKIGENLINTSSSKDNTKSPLDLIVKEVFKECDFKNIYYLSALTSVNCNIGLEKNFSDPLLMATVNVTYDINRVVALEITRVSSEQKIEESLLGSFDGVKKEPVQCEFIDVESDASNDISVNLISFQGSKRFILKEHFKKLSDKQESIVTVYYNTSKNCKLLESDQGKLTEISEYSKNPIFHDNAVPEEVKNIVVRAFPSGLAAVSINKLEDINNDGHADYLAVGGGGYCGSAGCTHRLIQSSKVPKSQNEDVKFSVVFHDTVHGIDVIRNPKSKIILRTYLHGSACGKVGFETCVKDIVWYKNKYIFEEEFIALTQVISLERALFCALVNARVWDTFRQSSDKDGNSNYVGPAYKYYLSYGYYMRKKHANNFSQNVEAIRGKTEDQIVGLDRMMLLAAQQKCNSDSRINAQRP